MRTRSQQQSPGGFVSLEATSRRTRSTRSASQTNAVKPTTTTTTGRSDPDPAEQSSGPSKQPATRAKGQRATTKSTATATKKKTTKATSKKAPAKATRKSTRKTAKATSEEPETHDDATPETTPESDENKENFADAVQDPESANATAEQALVEQDDAQSESTYPQDQACQPAAPLVSDALHPAPIAPNAPNAPTSLNSPTSPRAFNPLDVIISNHSPVGTIGTSWTELLENISDIGSPLSERSRTPSLDEPLFTDGELDEFLLEQLRGTRPAHDSEQEGRGAGQYIRSTEDSAWEQPEAPSTFESPAVAEPPAAESTESVAVKNRGQEINQPSEADSLSTAAVGSGGETVAESEQVDNLAQLLAKLNLADFCPRPAAVVSPELPAGPTWQPETAWPARDPSDAFSTVGSGSSDYYASQAAGSVAPVDPRRPSIFDAPPPPFELPLIEECARRQAQQTRSLITLARRRPRSYIGDLGTPWHRTRARRRGVLVSEALAEGRRRRPLVSPAAAREPRRPLYPVSAPVRLPTSVLGSRPRVLGILSPIPELWETGTSPSPGRSKVGAEEVARVLSASSAAFQAPMVFRNARNTPSLLANPDQPCVRKKLTHTKVNRKRAHSALSDDEPAAGGPETPIANKRRNLGVPGSTPFARRLPPLSRRLSSTSVPYSERLRRRQAEREGRIHRTMYRLPEYIAQEVRDRQAAETAGQQSPCPEPPLAHDDTSEEPEEAQEHQDQPVEDAPAEPTPKLPPGISSSFPSALPETPRRGWNIRGLLNSVPRSFSRLIPGLKRSSARSAQTELSPASSSTEPTTQPASERIDRPIEEDPAYIAARAKFRPWQPRRRLTEEPAPRPRILDYSLWPRPMDRSLYLGDIATPLRDQPDPSTLQSLQPSSIDTPDEQITTATVAATSKPTTPIEDTSVSQAQDTRGRETSQKASSKKEKKRKREPSPDVIPNPPGCSYGMDTDYFWYSSESEDESDTGAPGPSTAPQQAGGLARTAVRSALRSDRPASKKVRFDASPEDTPSKLRTRARATDPYTGSHFIGMGGGSPSSSFAPPSPTPSAPTPTPPVQAPSIQDEDLYGPSPIVDPRTRPGFVPNTQGTFQLDYDAFSDDSSESSGPSSPPRVASPSPVPAEETQPTESPESPAPPAAPSPASLPTPVVPPSTPAAPVDDEALAKVRSQAERHKPKTPSRLRTASRYSSPMTITPEARVSEARVESAPVEKPVEESDEDFGDDEFARDAQWLYENCPSGDLTQLQWPDRQGYQESLGVSQTAIDLVAQVWKDSEADEAYKLFCQGFEEFKQQA